MEVILSRNECEFIKDLIELIKKYGVLFCINEEKHISISVNERYKGRKEFLNPYLDLGTCCDEEELYELLEQTNNRLLEIVAEYKPEELKALRELKASKAPEK